MVNISAFGLSAQCVASVTFPNGFPITAFADDADPLDTTELAVADSAMGLNGDHVVWNRPSVIEITINVIARSKEDTNLQILHEANRVSKGKSSAKDIVGLTFTYPDGLVASLSGGIIATGEVLPQVSNAGRLKTRQYHFRFESITRTNM